MEYYIREVKNEEEAVIADEMLTKLITDERNYDSNVNIAYKVKNYYKNRKENTCLAVAVDKNEKVIGFAFAYIIDETVYIERKVILDALYVEVDYRKQGIADRLEKYIEEWTRSNNIKIMELSVCTENIKAYNLYKKIGFNNTKYIMQKRLNEDKKCI